MSALKLALTALETCRKAHSASKPIFISCFVLKSFSFSNTWLGPGHCALNRDFHPLVKQTLLLLLGWTGSLWVPSSPGFCDSGAGKAQLLQGWGLCTQIRLCSPLQSLCPELFAVTVSCGLFKCFCCSPIQKSTPVCPSEHPVQLSNWLWQGAPSGGFET